MGVQALACPFWAAPLESRWGNQPGRSAEVVTVVLPSGASRPCFFACDLIVTPSPSNILDGGVKQKTNGPNGESVALQHPYELTV